MFKALLASMVAVFLPSVANATPIYRYVEPCWVFEQPTMCVVIDTRTSDGFLNTRNIFNDKYSYTFRSYWREGKGFVSWDSVSREEYKFPYQAVRELVSQVSPHLAIMNVSWD